MSVSSFSAILRNSRVVLRRCQRSVSADSAIIIQSNVGIWPFSILCTVSMCECGGCIKTVMGTIFSFGRHFNEYLMLLRSAKACLSPPSQTNGRRSGDCVSPHWFESTCEFECDAGYQLPPEGTAVIRCALQEVTGTGGLIWSETPTPCESERM